MRLELLSAGLSFGASSLFWLAAALQVDAALYGSVMQLQALLMLSAGVFSLRTYDLVFHLEKHHGWPLGHAWRRSLRLETGLLLIGALACSVLLQWSALRPRVMADEAWALWFMLAALANLPILQGASAALLRGLQRDHDVAKADLAAALAWATALLPVTSGVGRSPSVLLVLAFAAGGVRPLTLLGLAWRARRADEDGVAPTANRRRILGYLVAGQLTNLLKNNLVAVETLLLGRMSGAEAVAQFRIARSLLNLTTVMLNVAYQRAFRELAKGTGAAQRAATMQRLTCQSLVLFAVPLPLCMLAAWLFAAWHEDLSYQGLTLVVVACALAMLPVALQQTPFAALSLDGRFEQINWAYGVSLVVLVGVALILAPAPLFGFLGVLLVAGVVRVLLLWRSSR